MEEKSTVYVASSLKKIEINCKIFNIKVLGTDKNQVELVWSETAVRSLEAKLQDGILTVSDHAAIAIYGPLELISLKRKCQLVIYIPASYQGKLILQTNDEKICVSSVFFQGNLGIASSVGQILLENVNARLIDIRGSHGQTECYAVKVEHSMDVSTDTGSNKCCINDDKENYTVYCKTTNASIPCPGCSGNGAKQLRLSSNYGAISVEFYKGPAVHRPGVPCEFGGEFKDW